MLDRETQVERRVAVETENRQPVEGQTHELATLRVSKAGRALEPPIFTPDPHQLSSGTHAGQAARRSGRDAIRVEH